ncbi:hypothetical protein [Streptomyces sp. NPDC058751]|uniref:hypothetical protein n=1 Tax=Streptomyces sp. NPDC058751 TaxID=3346623 RepID=UPI0036B3C54D
MAAMAVTALTGCGGGDSVGAAGERATTTARATEAAAKDELTVDAVQGDVRAAAAAAGIGRLGFADTKGGTPCRVIGALRTEDAPKRAAVDAVSAVMKARGWEQTEQMQSEEGSPVRYLVKNGWDMFLTAGKVPEGAGIVFDASGEACGVPMPSRPAASDIAPPEPPVLP